MNFFNELLEPGTGSLLLRNPPDPKRCLTEDEKQG
jgi:hypothetical protein